MSFFFKGKEVEAVLFSPLEGKLTYQGKPAANAKLKLWIAWKDKEGETDVYYADNHGHFAIPQITATYRNNPLAQLVVRQRLTVLFEGQEFVIWRLSKMEGIAFTELGGRPVNLSCEMTNEEVTVRGNRSLGGTRCTWEALDVMENMDENS